MEILLTNVGQDPIEIDVDDWDLKRYRDAHKASELNLKCSRRIPITKYALVTAREDGKTYFRGYIRSPKIKNITTRELVCRGEEELLKSRLSGRFSYSPGSLDGDGIYTSWSRNLGHIFQSDAPTQTPDAYVITGNVGLLFMANSLIPFHGNVVNPGHFLYTKNGGGTTVVATAVSEVAYATFTLMDLGSGKTGIRCYDGSHYLYATGGGGSTVTAGAHSSSGNYIRFVMSDLGGGKVSFQTYDGTHYLTATGGGGTTLMATATSVGNYETFDLIDVGGGMVAIGCYDRNVANTPNPGNWIAHGHDWIYMLTGLGSDSRIGTKDIYTEGTLLPRVADYATLESTDLSAWSSADNLWVRCDNDTLNDGFGPRKMLLAANAYDTGVRKGTIDKADTILTGNLQLNFDPILDMLVDLAEYHGLEPQWRYEADHTYFDALENPVENEFTLPEEYLKDVNQSGGNELRPHALIGLGAGSQDVQHVYTPSDHSWLGPWIGDTFEVNQGFMDSMGNLIPVVDAEYARRIDDEIFSVSPVGWPYAPKPNDLVLLQLIGEEERSLQVASVARNMKGDLSMELGSRKDDILDAFNARGGLSKTYYKEFLVDSGKPGAISKTGLKKKYYKNYLAKFGKAISASGDLIVGDTTHGICTGESLSFTVPALVKQDDWSHRVTMDISVSCDVAPCSCKVFIEINGSANLFCGPGHYMLGDLITSLDITRYVNYGSASTFEIWIQKNGDWEATHTSCSEHPTADVSITVKSWQRPTT